MIDLKALPVPDGGIANQGAPGVDQSRLSATGLSRRALFQSSSLGAVGLAAAAVVAGKPVVAASERWFG